MFAILVSLIRKIFGKKYKALKHKINRKYPLLNKNSIKNYRFKNYRKSFRFSNNQLYFYFISLCLSGILMIGMFLYSPTFFKHYNFILITYAVIIVISFDIYPRVVNLRKRIILRKRKIHIEDKLNKLFILNLNDDVRIPFDFMETVELKKSQYVSWEHELKLLAIEKNYNVIFNIVETSDGYVRANFGKKNM